MQDLKNFKKVIFTLHSGKQISILSEESLIDGKISGFEATPLIVKKSIVIDPLQIAATEIIEDPHIVWGDAISNKGYENG
jgi:hypothetical protein